MLMPGGDGQRAMAQPVPREIAERLNAAQLEAYTAYLRAFGVHSRALDGYWVAVDALRQQRRRKREASQPFSRDDYMLEQPPIYAGPPMPQDVARIIAALAPPQPETPRPDVAVFLAHARALYGFVPERTSEREFKRRYADEALSVGLTKTHVVRVYALETGGRGTYDMQAGIDPETKAGKPISSALGYAQLLHANSVNELVKHGEGFISRLLAMSAVPGTAPQRVAALRAKAIVLRRMLKQARSVPNEWSAHVAFAGTPHGLGIHAINLDADIGPWLQVLKLHGLLIEAQKAGRMRLSGAEIELMNLAGPRTGLEMMEPVGRAMPTSNFFSRAGYYRNTIVRGKTAAELLTAIDERMEVGLRKPGAVEFAAVFDEVMARRSKGAPSVAPAPPAAPAMPIIPICPPIMPI